MKVCPRHCVWHFGDDQLRVPARGAENVPWERY